LKKSKNKKQINTHKEMTNIEINVDVATNDINAWLDAKRVRSTKRTEMKSSVDGLVKAVQDGLIVFDSETGFLTQTLLWPIGENEGVKTFNYKLRLNSFELDPFLKNVSSGDGDGRLRAYVAALTSQLPSVVSKLDTEDLSIAQSIAVFFL
jgi:hypothetical protein